MAGNPDAPDASLDNATSNLKLALRDRLAGGPMTVAQIRESVCSVVGLMRAAGVPPEKMLHAVKDMMQEGGMAPSGSATRMSTGELDMLYPNMVMWCIDAYYKIDPVP